MHRVGWCTNLSDGICSVRMPIKAPGRTLIRHGHLGVPCSDEGSSEYEATDARSVSLAEDVHGSFYRSLSNDTHISIDRQSDCAILTSKISFGVLSLKPMGEAV